MKFYEYRLPIHGDHYHELDWIGKSWYSLLYCIFNCDIKLHNLLFDADL